MDSGQLLLVAIFLAVAAVMAPLGRRFKLGTVLGYLLGGMIIAQFDGVLGIGKPEDILHTAELGVAMFLFLIGLELKPRRLWSFRYSVFVVGGAQVMLTALALTLIGVYFGYAVAVWTLVGLAVALSSTAFALQILDEKGELQARHGRLAFSILLFQDIAAIPIIALVPVFATGVNLSPGETAIAAAKALGAVAALIIVGRFVLDRLYRLVASTGVREAMTASALLTVVSAVMLMQAIGMSPALGAFIAGVLLADSEYRHQLASDIAPFEALLLGVFFTAIGLSLDIGAIIQQPGLIAMGVAGLVTVKAVILYGIGRWQGLDNWAARRLALTLSQGGEFAFVIFAAAASSSVLSSEDANILAVVVTLSMVATPLLLLIDDKLDTEPPQPTPAYDTPPAAEQHIVIAGFGRFGQIVARILRARRIPFTALDIDPEQVSFVGQFDNKIYYGDASRLTVLEAAETAKARAFVLAIDDMETSVATAQLVKRYFPKVPIYARARNRQHVHRLMDLGVEHIERETYHSALELTRDLLRGLGIAPQQVRYMVETFKEHDERRLYDDYKHYTDLEKVFLMAKKQSQELEELFAQDIQETERTMARTDGPAKPKQPDAPRKAGAPRPAEPERETAQG
ncbi:MAG: cation:proton antiporter [Hyphomicrobiales bacterium]|nr:cation:proton antiporter [Hyphomicrobiales bacterium]